MTLQTYCWSKEKAEKIFKKNLRHIKNTIERKIDLYKPLEFETTYPEFLEWIQQEEFKVIREIPTGFKVKTFLDDLVKNFLIERAYYALAEKYIRNRMMRKLEVSDPNDIRVLEITDFIMKEIEKDGLARLKKFEERAEFRYFLGMVITNLWYDFLREIYKAKKNLTKFDSEFESLYERPVDSPYDLIIKLQDEELKKEAAGMLPQILENLAPEEKLAIKWKYEDDLNISSISRALGKTRYKTEKLLEETEEKIRRKILLKIKADDKNCMKENEKNQPQRTHSLCSLWLKNQDGGQKDTP
jgi:RNA polymerase sigma factor (sigma-70 family)